MSRVGLLEQLYLAIARMTTDNGYYFNYSPYKGDMDIDNGTLLKKGALVPQISIIFGDETNVDEFDGFTTGEYYDNCPVTIQVMIQTGQTSIGEWLYEHELIKAKVIDDVKRRFNSAYLFAGNSVKSWKYLGEADEPSTPNQDLYGLMVYFSFEVTYTTDRAINNN